MKKVLFGCIGAGLAVGGAYFLYKKWQKSQQQCQEKNNEPTLEKSEHFIPNFDEEFIERNGISVCANETNRNASNEGETETANVHKTEDCHAESLKPENALAKDDKTEHDVQRGQDLPLSADGAWNNTSNMSDANFSIIGPNCVKIHLKGSDNDENALYGDMNAFFASLSKADKVSHSDTEHTTVEPGQIFKAGPSPSTSVFQPNGVGTKQASKQLANRRRRTRKHKKN